MLDGALPATAAERDAFVAEIRARRAIPDAVRAVLPAIAAVATPLDGLRAALSLSAADRGLRPLLDTAPSRRRDDALFLTALAPTLLCALHHLRAGLDVIEARPDLGHADVARRLAAVDPAAAGLVGFAEQTEACVVALLDELKPGRQLRTNVEFFAGVVMELCGIPRDMFTPTFASSRVIGWCANVLEQAADNKIIRPSARYVGPPPPQPIPRLG
jgi:citrate synthase